MKKHTTFRWGIIGLGKIAHHFAKDIARIDDAEIYAVASRSLDRAQAFADEYQCPHACGSYEALMNIKELDAIYVATPHTGHHAHTMLCLEHGFSVLCEKPLAVNSQQVGEMLALAQSKNVFLMEALWTRFLPSFSTLVDLIKADKLGDLISIKADFGFKATFDAEGRLFNPNLAGGALLDIGIYPVFLAYLLLGKPLEIKAIATFAETGVDDEVGILMEFAEGKTAHLHATLKATTPCIAEIYGTKGKATIDSRWHETDEFEIDYYDYILDEYRIDTGCKGYRFEAEHVMECVRAGQSESPILPLAFSRDLMGILDAIRKEIGLIYPMDK